MPTAHPVVIKAPTLAQAQAYWETHLSRWLPKHALKAAKENVEWAVDDETKFPIVSLGAAKKCHLWFKLASDGSVYGVRVEL